MIWCLFFFGLCIAPCYFLIRTGIHHIFLACFLPEEYDSIYANMTLRERITLVIDKKHLKREGQFHNDYTNFILLKRILVIAVISAIILNIAALLLDWMIIFRIITYGTILLMIPLYIIVSTRLEPTPGDLVWIYDTQRSRKNGKRRK